MTDKNIYKNNKAGKIIKTIAVSILFGILFTFVLSLIMGYKYKFVVTSSMEPTYKTKSCIIAVCPCDYQKDVKIGDVITWGAGKTTFTHRVVGQITKVVEGGYEWTDGETTYTNNITGNYKVGMWIARGDNPTISFDNIQAVNEKNFVGKVNYYSNFIGAIVNYIQTNLFLVIFCVIVIFISSMIFL